MFSLLEDQVQDRSRHNREHGSKFRYSYLFILSNVKRQVLTFENYLYAIEEKEQTSNSRF